LPGAIPRSLPVTEPKNLPATGLKKEHRKSSAGRQQLRIELARLLLEPGPGPRQGLAALAAETGWPLPETVTLAAIRAPDKLGAGVPAAVDGTALDGEVIADLAGPHPCLVVPGAVTRPRGLELASAFEDRRIAIGLTVPLTSAPDSLRWARRALALAESGVIDAGPLIWCEDHLVTLWLLSDPRLADQVVRQQLGILADLTPRQRARVLDTLGPWLEQRGTAAEIAALLHVHPQTVRYRIRQIERAFGDRLASPDARFSLELSLRLLRLLRRHTAPRQYRPADG